MGAKTGMLPTGSWHDPKFLPDEINAGLQIGCAVDQVIDPGQVKLMSHSADD